MEIIDLFRKQIDLHERGAAPTDKIRPGVQGKVAALIDSNGKKIACKIIEYGDRTNPEKAIVDFEREYESLRAVPHPSIVQFLHFEHHKDKKVAYLRMEWAGSELAETPGGAIDLADVIEHHQASNEDRSKSPPESFIWHVLFHLGAALALCHHGVELHRELVPVDIDSDFVLKKLIGQPSERLAEVVKTNPLIKWTTEKITFNARKSHEPIIHRDIKPRNILLADPPLEQTSHLGRSKGDISLGDPSPLQMYPKILLGDFGLSVPLRVAQTRGVGTIGYAAPEVPLEPSRPGCKPFNWQTSCDIFSLGATVRHLMTLEAPDFPDQAASVPFPLQYSQPLQDLVERCLDRDHSGRPTAVEILDTCILHQYWRDTWISPYGVPIAPGFTESITKSWQDCMQLLAEDLDFKDFRSSETAQTSGLALTTVDVLSLDRQTEASALSMLIAGTYLLQLINPETGYRRYPRNITLHDHSIQNFRVEPSSRYDYGEVFKVLWSEPLGQNSQASQMDNPFTDYEGLQEANGGLFYTGIRRFVVIGTDGANSICVPILTYGRQGCKKGSKPEKHGIIYKPPHRPRALPNEPALGIPPVRLEIYVEGEKLSRESRINYSKHITIEHNWKVLFIGRIYPEDHDMVEEAINTCWEQRKRTRHERRK